MPRSAGQVYDDLMTLKLRQLLFSLLGACWRLINVTKLSVHCLWKCYNEISNYWYWSCHIKSGISQCKHSCHRHFDLPILEARIFYGSLIIAYIHPIHQIRWNLYVTDISPWIYSLRIKVRSDTLLFLCNRKQVAATIRLFSRIRRNWSNEFLVRNKIVQTLY